jgi:hypothetical protein
MSLVIVRVLIKVNHIFKFQGTAFFINECTLITAKHILENPLKRGYEIWLSDIPNGGKLLITEYDIDSCERDIAILRTKKKFEIEEVFFTDLAFEKKVKIQGYHNEDGTISSSCHIVSGYVNYEHTYELQHHSTNGFSGSPIIYNGKVCGVATAIHRKDNITFVIPISECSEELKKYQITVKKIYPFIGLKAFNQENSQFFFGRDEEIKSLLHKLERENIIAIVGDSGSGKSSFVQAGMIPAYLAQNNHEDSAISFETIQIRPAENPFDELRFAIGERCNRLGLSPQDRDYYKNQIEVNNPKAIRGVFEALFNAKQVALLFYIDQFEELFTLSKEPYQEPFIELLLYLYNNQLSKLKIQAIFTIRTDAYYFEDKYQAFVNLIDKSKCRLRLMEGQALKDCVIEPLLLGGIDKQKAKDFADEILEDMDKNQDNSLTLLQIALTQTWQHKTEENTLIDAYIDAEKITGALNKLATDTMTSLISDNEPMFEVIFMRLMKFGDNNKIRRRRLADKEEFSNQEWELVKKLASLLDANGEVTTSPNSKGGRLLVIHGQKDGRQMVELVHESLMTQWTIYKKWINNVANQVDLKRFHEVVIEKTKEHKRKEASLLMGSDLDKGLMLLNSEYRQFLSKDEVAYVERSLRDKKRSKVYKIIFFIGFILLVVIVFFLDKENDKTQRSLDDISLKNDKTSSDIETQITVATSFFIQARTFEKLNKQEKALSKYIEIIELFQGIDSSLLQRIVAGSMYNRSHILIALSRLNEGREVFYELINVYVHTKDKIILKYISGAYAQLGWLKILEQEYEDSIILLKKGVDKKSNYYVNIKLAHAYLLIKKVNKADEIYLRYREYQEDIIKDFETLRRHYIISDDFDRVQKLLKKRIINGSKKSIRVR